MLRRAIGQSLPGKRPQTKLARGYKTMTPEEYLLNQRDANNVSRVHMTSLFPLKNASKLWFNKIMLKGQPTRLNFTEFLTEKIGKTNRTGETFSEERWTECTQI